jgi:IS5 family transposase
MTGNALVGRAHEIEDLVKSFHRAQAGEAQLALIGGEQGLGKASLLREVERMAKSRGARRPARALRREGRSRPCRIRASARPSASTSTPIRERDHAHDR